jgi:hypothetical protein
MSYELAFTWTTGEEQVPGGEGTWNLFCLRTTTTSL